MIALSMETSARVGSVALAVGAEVEVVELPERSQTRSLAFAIDDLLRSRGLRAADLDLLAVSIGPGGYTGLRLGLATAKALAVVLDKPIVGVPSTEVYAAHDAVPAGPVLVALDARKGLLYGARYIKETSVELREISAPRCEPVERVAAACEPSTFCVGDGLSLVRAAVDLELAGAAEIVPSARDLLRLALARFARDETDPEPSLLPLYLRPSEAELLWRDRQRTDPSEDAEEKA